MRKEDYMKKFLKENPKIAADFFKAEESYYTDQAQKNYNNSEATVSLLLKYCSEKNIKVQEILRFDNNSARSLHNYLEKNLENMIYLDEQTEALDFNNILKILHRFKSHLKQFEIIKKDKKKILYQRNDSEKLECC